MAAADDAATVLEMFCQDVANLPAEIAHLLEEIQAKDQQIMHCRDMITSRDASIQKHIRMNGSHVRHPKEDAFTKTITTNYDRIQILQAEKLGLSEKAMIVLERQIKRFDVKLRDLQATDQFPVDPSLPSLLQPSSANTAPPLSGVSTPLNQLSINTAQGGGAPNIANAAIARLGASNTSRSHSPLTAQNPILAQSHLAGSAARNARENSADASKRRRLNASISNMPAQGSSLRQSSIGPGASTPKPGTPGPTSSSRAGSAQPNKPSIATKKAPAGTKKVAPHHAAAAAAAAAGAGGAASRKRARSSLPLKKGDRRKQLAREPRGGGRGGNNNNNSPSASPTPSDSHASTSPTPSNPHGHDGTADKVSRGGGHHRHRSASAEAEGEADAEGEEDDTQTYCLCDRVSFGDMVACDNEDCKYQWFHWGCVGLKEEPKGEWLCPECRTLPREKIVKAK